MYTIFSKNNTKEVGNNKTVLGQENDQDNNYNYCWDCNINRYNMYNNNSTIKREKQEHICTEVTFVYLTGTNVV